MTTLAILGSGAVGQTLADGFLKHGHDVIRGSREPAKLAAWKDAAGPRASVGTFEEAAARGQVAILAVKGSAAEAVIAMTAAALRGKTVLDATNPLADGGPENGILRVFTGPNESLMERLQQQAPGVRFVKAFSSVGNMHMIDPDFGGQRPTMFIGGDDEGAKAKATALLEQVGWDVEDLGGASAARAIEPLCVLWCARGFRSKQWGHAFKLRKK